MFCDLTDNTLFCVWMIGCELSLLLHVIICSTELHKVSYWALGITLFYLSISNFLFVYCFKWISVTVAQLWKADVAPRSAHRLETLHLHGKRALNANRSSCSITSLCITVLPFSVISPSLWMSQTFFRLDCRTKKSSFLYHSLLQGFLSHPKIPQRRECESPYLLPDTPISCKNNPWNCGWARNVRYLTCTSRKFC